MNKTVAVIELISDFDLDICCVTETWLKKTDTAKFSEIRESGYNIHSKPRSGRGGGVAFVYKDSITLSRQATKTFRTFECIESTLVSSTGELLRLCCIYRSGTKTSIGSNFPLFLEDFEQYLIALLEKPGKPIICGDFNIHMEDLTCPNTVKFTALLSTNGWKQHVKGETHVAGGTLDLILTRVNVTDLVPMKNLQITPTPTTSDHYFVTVNCKGSINQRTTPEPVAYRNIDAIDIEKFKSDLISSPLCDHRSFSNLDIAVQLYNDELSAILDKHAPLKHMTPRPNCPEWWNGDCQTARQLRRTCERIKCKLKTTESKHNYKVACKESAAIIKITRENFYKTKLNICKNDSKQTSHLIKRLLDKSFNSNILPTSTSDLECAEKMKEFFKGKVDKIYKDIEVERSEANDSLGFDCTFGTDHPTLEKFSTLDTDTLADIIKEMPNKHCPLDPIPTKLLVQCLPELLPILSYIVNSSLQDGVFPQALKSALLRPTIKNIDLDSEVLSNYRPISNLAFISKVLEKCVHKQLGIYLEENHLLSKFQSGYRKFHSCETATTLIHNDILIMCDKGSNVILLLLDLSAAFDTVNHKRLLNKLQKFYNISGPVLDWFESYLKNRDFSVKIKNCVSEKSSLDIGVPQGSILGPLLFIMYTKDLEKIVASHGFVIHLYADDTQIYFTFDSVAHDDPESKISACMKDIKSWMLANFLKLNAGKTEVMAVRPKRSKLEIPDKMTISENEKGVEIKESVKSLGAYLDNTLSMSSHVTAVVKACNMNLRNLWFIGSKLSQKLKLQLVNSLILSRLDYCNSVLYGITKCDLSRLQKAQNSAVRFIFGNLVGRRDHISPFLQKAHFLPVRFRIEFKICLLVFKCINNIAPSYLQELLRIRDPKNNALRADDDYYLLLQPSIPSLRMSDNAFSYCGPRIWNNLPYVIRSCNALTSFKSRLKTHFFKLAFSNI